RSSSTSSPPTPHATGRTESRAHRTGPRRRGSGRALVWRGTVSAARHPPVPLPSRAQGRAEASADGKRGWVKLTAPLLVLRRREPRELVRRNGRPQAMRKSAPFHGGGAVRSPARLHRVRGSALRATRSGRPGRAGELRLRLPPRRAP